MAGIFYLDVEHVDQHIDELHALVRAHPSPGNQRVLLGVRYMIEDGQNATSGLALAREICSYSRAPEMVVLRGVDDRRALHELLRARCHRGVRPAARGHAPPRALATSIPMHRHWASGLTAAAPDSCGKTGPEVEVAIDSAAAFARHAGIRDAAGLQTLQTFVLRYQQDRTREVITGLATPTDDAPPVLAGISLLGLSFAAAGRFDQADRSSSASSPTRSDCPATTSGSARAAMLADVAASCGTDRQRACLYDALLPVADQCVVFGTGGVVLGTGHHWLGRSRAPVVTRVTAREHLRSAPRRCATTGTLRSGSARTVGSRACTV